MNCPECGTPIPEGKLYCPGCGYAVQMVPDYDADLEDNLNSVGSDIAGTVNRIDVADSNKTEYDTQATTKQIPMVRKDEASSIRRRIRYSKEKSDRFSTFVVAGLLMIALAAGTVIAYRGMAKGSFIPERAVNAALSSNRSISVDYGNDAAYSVPESAAENDMTVAEEDSVSSDDLFRQTLEVSPESGEYFEPELISATVSGNEEGVSFNGIIYYTDDGSEPDERSRIYRNEIEMPIGESHYAFRLLDDRGNLSETVYLDYKLGYNGACSPEHAVNLCVAKLIQDGALLDPAGHVPGSLGTFGYKCETLVRYGNRVYYMIPEYFCDPGAAAVPTGTIYAVDADNMGLYRVKRGAGGKYVFEMFY